MARAAAARTVSRLAFWIVAAGGLGLVVLDVAAPLMGASHHPALARALYVALAKACHQDPARSFSLLGWPMGACARCTGLYFGALLGTLLVPLVRGIGAALPRRRWLVVAALPCALDVGLDWVGLVGNTLASRAATGMLLGGVAAFYVVPSVVAAGLAVAAGRRRRAGSGVDGASPQEARGGSR